jgi:hypothetical protein
MDDHHGDPDVLQAALGLAGEHIELDLVNDKN